MPPSSWGKYCCISEIVFNVSLSLFFMAVPNTSSNWDLKALWFKNSGNGLTLIKSIGSTPPFTCDKKFIGIMWSKFDLKNFWYLSGNLPWRV